MDWTHTCVRLKDIRKAKELYIISINDGEIKSPLFVDEKIFNERLKSYFLKDIDKISREEIIKVNWNFYITKGHYVKLKNGEIEKVSGDKNKHYVSFLDINGDLSNFNQLIKT